MAYQDHHCPWINNCVGIFTLKPFLLFNMYAFITAIYSFSILYEPTRQELVKSIDLDFSPSLCVLLLTESASLSFSLFIFSVFIDQITVISNRQTVIDHVRLYDRQVKPNRRAIANFKVAFGETKFSLKWLVPTVIRGEFRFEDMYH